MYHAHRQTFFEAYDVASAGYTYGRFSDEQSAPKYIKTAGSSATTVEMNTGDGSLAPVAVGSRLFVQLSPDATPLRRTLTAKASDASGTVDSAWDLSAGYNYRFQNFYSGTAVTDGWVARGIYNDYDLQIIITTIAATSIEVQIEGRNRGVLTEPAIILTKSYTAVTLADTGVQLIPIQERCDEIRVGVKVTADGGVQSVSVYGIAREDF